MVCNDERTTHSYEQDSKTKNDMPGSLRPLVVRELDRRKEDHFMRILLFVRSLSRAMGIFCMLTFILPTVSAQQKIQECDEAACHEKKGVWNCSQEVGIKGDGGPAVTVTATASAGAALCGSARSKRQRLSNEWESTCRMDPPSPTVENSKEREGTCDSSDMTVEKCWKTTGANSSLSCQYVNSKNAPPKYVEVCGCYA